MAYNEILEKLQSIAVLDQQKATESYNNIEKVLSEHICQFILNEEVNSLAYGKGRITNTTGKSFNTITFDVVFTTLTKRFALLPIITNTKFIKFTNEELYEPLTTALTLHNNLTTTYNEFKFIARREQIKADKKAEAEKKAEAKYLERREKAIKDFDNLVQSRSSAIIRQEEEFYYALGWLTKHVGTITAILPDYLEASFMKYFGTGTPCRIVDSKKRSPAGWQAQWSWHFKASIKKAEEAPAILRPYLNPVGNAVTNTSFLWDLLDNYGFQFGKKQNIEMISKAVPAKYLDIFNAGLVA